MTVRGFLVAQILQFVGVDRPSEREMSFVGPQQVTQPIAIFHIFETPTPQMPLRFTESPGNKLAMPMDFRVDSIGGSA
ncbi:hypothetical protein TNCV_2987971 [Trichonephila clavipes]|nr:hypothetical protein TNCV_2987971 [Trichonephila clavipes]